MDLLTVVAGLAFLFALLVLVGVFPVTATLLAVVLLVFALVVLAATVTRRTRV